VLTGYRLESSGSSGSGGYSYSSIELFDADYMLVRSEYSDGSGYRSTYSIETQRDGAGNVTGYVTRYSWTDGTASYSSTDRFDGAWNYLDGDSSKPDLIVDDGPAVLPVVTQDTERVTEVAVASAASSGSQTLDGGNKRGAKLQGSSGDDLFIVDDTSDRATGSGAGDDTVMSRSISLDLQRSAFKGIENAGLVGRDHLNLRGNSGANELSGNAGDNRLDGYGGGDTLFGGLGEDVFIIRSGQKNATQQLTDFTSGEDSIALLGRGYRGLFDRSGGLKDGVIGDRLLFDAETGGLSFDRDGATGSRNPEVIAVLIGVDDINATDFVRA
jgi:Ca2+-binding RTX toxin-like protein